MRVAGLTGGIASGKSTVAASLAAAGVPVVDCDAIAHDVVRQAGLGGGGGSEAGGRSKAEGTRPSICRRDPRDCGQ